MIDREVSAERGPGPEPNSAEVLSTVVWKLSAVAHIA